MPWPDSTPPARSAYSARRPVATPSNTSRSCCAATESNPGPGTESGCSRTGWTCLLRTPTSRPWRRSSSRPAFATLTGSSAAGSTLSGPVPERGLRERRPCQATRFRHGGHASHVSPSGSMTAAGSRLGDGPAERGQGDVLRLGAAAPTGLELVDGGELVLGELE